MTPKEKLDALGEDWKTFAEYCYSCISLTRTRLCYHPEKTRKNRGGYGECTRPAFCPRLTRDTKPDGAA